MTMGSLGILVASFSAEVSSFLFRSVARCATVHDKILDLHARNLTEMRDNFLLNCPVGKSEESLRA